MERRYFFVGERFSPMVSASCSVDPFKPDFYEVVSHRTGFWPPGFATSPAREKRLWKCLGASRAARSTWSRIYDRGARRDRARVHRLDRVASSESNYYFLDETRATKQDAPSSGTLSLFQLFQEVCSLYHFFFFFLFSFLFFFFFFCCIILELRHCIENFDTIRWITSTGLKLYRWSRKARKSMQI